MTTSAVALSGCELAANPFSSVLRTDSAGVEIVLSKEPAWTPESGWRLSDSPTLVIGKAEGLPEEMLFRAINAFELADGRIAIANAGTHQIRFFDANGVFLSQVGAQGEGPGEYRGISRIERLPGDSLLIFDQTGRRMTVLDSHGTVGHTYPALRYEDASATTVGVFADGSILMKTLGFYGVNDARRGMGVIRDTSTYFVTDHDGTILRTIGRFPAIESLMPSRESGIIVMTMPYGRVGLGVLGDDELIIGPASANQLEFYSLDGALTRIVRWDEALDAITPDDVSGALDRRLETARDQPDSIRIRGLFAEIEYPATMPAYSDVRRDALGNIWVADYRPRSDSENRWLVFSAQGEWLGALSLPQGFAPYKISADHVLGRRSDELGIERVERYALVKPQPE